jgi:hypothetical protein
MLKATGLIAAIGRREYVKDGATFEARSVTLVDQEDGTVAQFDVDEKRVNGLLDEQLHAVCTLNLSYGRFWKDTPQGRRPETVVRVIGVAA